MPGLCVLCFAAALAAFARLAGSVGPVVRCEPCDAGALLQCKPLPKDCAERVREPGCGCCITCALGEGQACGVYTARCGSGLTCQHQPGESRPLQALLEGRGVCSSAASKKLNSILVPTTKQGRKWCFFFGLLCLAHCMCVCVCGGFDSSPFPEVLLFMDLGRSFSMEIPIKCAVLIVVETKMRRLICLGANELYSGLFCNPTQRKWFWRGALTLRSHLLSGVKQIPRAPESLSGQHGHLHAAINRCNQGDT